MARHISLSAAGMEVFRHQFINLVADKKHKNSICVASYTASLFHMSHEDLFEIDFIESDAFKNSKIPFHTEHWKKFDIWNEAVRPLTFFHGIPVT